ncbi:MAG: efflux transporter outer membrane subunit [Methylobacter sp.]|uniref:efflux transporter outer membrane subunit n=1 Tax=Methylobacter sp. TaxID=2051955 RepID=UPI002590389A|nr:efflux transporter outer membrane subunit [Methylobacter sp.]MCL7423092.1 efflux transporter outer membrane subunit [Methylobacter sp.]
MLKSGKTALWLSLLLLPGCMVGPDYRPPQTDLPAAWSQSVIGAAAAGSADISSWWRTFNDPVLSELIEKAQLGNRELRQAESRVREARARRQLAQANLWPTSSLSASASKSGSSKEAGFRAGATGIGMTYEMYSYSLDASWELDLFGKQRRAIESADASEQAAREDLRDVLVSLYAEAALNYVDLRSLQQRLSITEANLAAQSETYDIARWRQMAGLTTQLDVDQAKLAMENTRAELPNLRSSLAQTKHNLALLLGLQPAALDALLDHTAPIPAATGGIATGIPADVLRQRPDVRRAERQLAAQTAQIGVAEAERYPDFTLSGSIGLESLAYSNLYSAGARAFQIAANAALTLLTALRNVENALTAYSEEGKRRDALTAAAEAGASAMELAEMQYVSGISDFQRVLEAQRSLLSAQLQLAASEAEVAADVIRLYKALGGGWQAEVTQEKTDNE